jgi:hypothetical protein
MTFSASVEIRAGAAETFALVSDLRRKARLNPNIRVIRIDLEGEEPIRVGSVFRHRFEKAGRIVEYRSRCVRWVPPRLVESRGETDPPFEVRVTIDPIDGGCRLTQVETLEMRPEMLGALGAERPPGRGLLDFVHLLPVSPALRALGSELRAVERERVVAGLRGELKVWLEAIRAHLEAEGEGE